MFYEDDLLPTDSEQLKAYLELQQGFPRGVHSLVREEFQELEVRVAVPLAAGNGEPEEGS